MPLHTPAVSLARPSPFPDVPAALEGAGGAACAAQVCHLVQPGATGGIPPPQPALHHPPGAPSCAGPSLFCFITLLRSASQPWPACVDCLPADRLPAACRARAPRRLPSPRPRSTPSLTPRAHPPAGRLQRLPAGGGGWQGRGPPAHRIHMQVGPGLLAPRGEGAAPARTLAPPAPPPAAATR